MATAQSAEMDRLPVESHGTLVERLSPGCRPHAGSFIERLCRGAHAGAELELAEADRTVILEYAGGPSFTTTLRDVAARVARFPDLRTTTEVPDFSDELTRRLYATYLASLEPQDLAWPLDVKADDRGFLASVLRSPRLGQLYVSRTKPGVVRANHWHDRKVERFLVVEGEAMVRLRRLDSRDVIERRVSGLHLEAIDVASGYVHNIENVGTTDMVLLFWLTEPFDPDDLDTHPASVTP